MVDLKSILMNRTCKQCNDVLFKAEKCLLIDGKVKLRIELNSYGNYHIFIID